MQNNRLNAQEGMEIISKQNWFDKYKTEYRCIFGQIFFSCIT